MYCLCPSVLSSINTRRSDPASNTRLFPPIRFLLCIFIARNLNPFPPRRIAPTYIRTVLASPPPIQKRNTHDFSTRQLFVRQATYTTCSAFTAHSNSDCQHLFVNFRGHSIISSAAETQNIKILTASNKSVDAIYK